MVNKSPQCSAVEMCISFTAWYFQQVLQNADENDFTDIKPAAFYVKPNKNIYVKGNQLCYIGKLNQQEFSVHMLITVRLNNLTLID